MKNCIILGSGRSGTSLTAGILSKSGYYMGDNLNPGNETNPKGQFEDRKINQLNEEILATVSPKRPEGIIGDIFFKSRPAADQRWLARIPLDVTLKPEDGFSERIRSFTKKEPFCFKDPRFSYTLPVWKQYLKNTVYICVFRDPSTTVSSILKQSKEVPHLKKFSINTKQAFKVWELMYSHILEKHYNKDETWIFVHYNQFFDNIVYKKLSDLLEAKVDHSFADKELHRSRPEFQIPVYIRSMYKKLSSLAGYNINE